MKLYAFDAGERVGVPGRETAGGMIGIVNRDPVKQVDDLIRRTAAQVHAIRGFGTHGNLSAADPQQHIGFNQGGIIAHCGERKTPVVAARGELRFGAGLGCVRVYTQWSK